MSEPSLVKYNTPVQVNVASKSGAAKKGAKKVQQEKAATQNEDILNSILPPR